MHTVRVDEPDPRFVNMRLEQFGGANGELAAAMQYPVQGLNCEDAACKDLLMDIGTEELAASMHDSDGFCTRRSARTEAIRPVGSV
jgi:Mn-containing catalase